MFPTALLVCAASLAAASSMRPAQPHGFPGQPIMPTPVSSESMLMMVNTLCTDMHQDSATTRDACYGCYMRVGNCNQSNKSLEALNDCATRYLGGTGFESCSEHLKKNQVDDEEGNLSEPFCKYESCLRKVSMGRLIEKCVNEVSGERINGAKQYLDITSCILAHLRCREKCGRRQAFMPSEQTVNALLVVGDNELRQVTVYSHMMQSYQCSSRQYMDPLSNTKQTDWSSATCE